MGYDLFIYKLSRPVTSYLELDAALTPFIDDIPTLQRTLARVAPDIRWSENAALVTGTLLFGDDDGLQFLFFPMFQPPADCLRAESFKGQTCYRVLGAICSALGWTAFDLQNRRLLGANIVGNGDTP